MSTVATLRFWHGGEFWKDGNGELKYFGSKMIYSLDCNHYPSCWSALLKLAKDCGKYEKIESIYYRVPGDGFRNVQNDDEVREMINVLLKHRCIECYVVHDADEVFDSDGLQPSEEGIGDNRGCFEGSEEIGPSEGWTTDEEYVQCREELRGWNANAKDVTIAKQLQPVAEQGKLVGQSQTHCEETTEEAQNNDFLSEYEDSEEEIATPDSNEDERLLKRRGKVKVPIVDQITNFETLQWRVGIRFENREKFRDAVNKYAIAQGRKLRWFMSNKKRQQRLAAKCTGECPFRIYGSWDNSRACFVVKRVELEHKCNKNMSLTSSWFADQFLELFKNMPHLPAQYIIETIRRAYKITVKENFANKVKYTAHKKLRGSMKEHYSKIGSYIKALKKVSPNSHFSLKTVPGKDGEPPIFQRLFMCFEDVKKGWLDGCRKVLCVAGCFLKTFLGGQLLSAVGRDGNDQMYPLCWAVVEGETNDSWEWFFHEMQTVLDGSDGTRMTFISNEAQSILNGVKKVFPNAEHRHCAGHVFAHWHKVFKGYEMEGLFWKAAKAYNEADYEKALANMKRVSPAAVDAFKSYNPKCFCRAFVKTDTRCDVIVNMAETFNAYIIKARTKHLLYMLEDIRSALMQRMVLKQQAMSKTADSICPRILTKLNKEKLESSHFCVIPRLRSDTRFKVESKLDKVTVDMENRTCTCNKWQLVGFPCCHAYACIIFNSRKPVEFVDSCYYKETYLTTYASSIPPCVGEIHLPKGNLSIDPPPIKVGPGRPRRNRRKTPHENPKKPGKLTKHGVEMTCSICKSKQHNKRKCPDKDKVVEPQPKRGRGRPRKVVEVENGQHSSSL